jgi:hypothetical protein
MTWYAWALIAYIVIDRIGTVAMIGRQIDLTPAFAVTSLVTGSLIVWAILSLAA